MNHKISKNKLQTHKNTKAKEQIKKNTEYLLQLIEWKYTPTYLMKRHIKLINTWLDTIQPNYEVIIP